MWTVQQYLVRPRAVLRCSVCGVERIGNYTQAKAGLLRCWTCSPKPPPQPRKRKPKPKKERPAAPPPVFLATPAPKPAGLPPREPPPTLTPIRGRVPTHAHAYARATRHQVEEEADVQHGRLELVGLRTRNPLNKRLTWQAAKTTAETAKRATIDALWGCVPRPEEGHPWSYELRLSRVSTKMSVDDDGVTAALKAVRDAFAIFVRINDANRRYLRVSYGSGHGRVQGVVLEWTRYEGPLAEEEEEASSFLFFDDDELVALAAEHRVTRRYWKERQAKRLVSIATRPAGLGTTDDEAEEEAAYDIAEEDEGAAASHESDRDG